LPLPEILKGMREFAELRYMYLPKIKHELRAFVDLSYQDFARNVEIFELRYPSYCKKYNNNNNNNNNHLLPLFVMVKTT